jgi:hypothetical protein
MRIKQIEKCCGMGILPVTYSRDGHATLLNPSSLPISTTVGDGLNLFLLGIPTVENLL